MTLISIKPDGLRRLENPESFGAANITKDKTTVGKILKDNGYRTSWFGKNHNAPAFQASATAQRNNKTSE